MTLEVRVRNHKRRVRSAPTLNPRRDPLRRQRPIRYLCPIERSEASGGNLEPDFYIYRMWEPLKTPPNLGSQRTGTIPIPDFAREKILRAQTPRGIERAIAEEESYIARQDGGREFLDCDEAANLMSAALRAKGIPHIMVVGESDEGSSHAYIIVDGRRYDPTHQGYGDGTIESATRWP